MKILAIDTSSSLCSVALRIHDETTALQEDDPKKQAQFVLPLIEQLLSMKKLSMNQIDAVSFGCGPGSFTGVRIATSVAQGLGYGLDIPLIPISSLAALAQTAFQQRGWDKLLVGIDARMQEVYWGAYEVNNQGLVELRGHEQVGGPLQLIFPPEPEWYGVGNAWDVYRPQIAFDPIAIDAACLPTAAGVLALAVPKFARKEWISAAEALPTYLRNNVAKKSVL